MLLFVDSTLSYSSSFVRILSVYCINLFSLLYILFLVPSSEIIPSVSKCFAPACQQEVSNHKCDVDSYQNVHGKPKSKDVVHCCPVNRGNKVPEAL